MRITRETPIILGSASPRRSELLSLAAVPFVVCAANADESTRIDEPAHAYLERVALAKLDAVRDAVRSPRFPGGGRGTGAILVADTIVVAPDGAVLGKPRDEDDGRRMIELLAGTTHSVCTRFLLAEGDPRALPAHGQTVTTRVTFRSLTSDEVASYGASPEGRDKAGGYAVQGGAAAFVERIEGSYTNVVGLPLAHVVTALRALRWLSA